MARHPSNLIYYSTNHYLASSQIRTDIFPTLLKCTTLYHISNNDCNIVTQSTVASASITGPGNIDYLENFNILSLEVSKTN